MPRSVARAYRDSMRRHRFGYALHEPPPFTRMHPGMLGYLDDEHQRWHPILDLSDPDAVAAAGYGPLSHLQLSEPDTRRYAPLTASNVTETALELGAGIGAAVVGLPIDLGAAVRFSTSGGFGAVLLCEGDVVSEGFDFRDPLRAWLQRHAKVLFARFPDARKCGLCAVSWTYSSSNIAISTWENAEGGVAVGFEVGAAGIAKAGPTVSRLRGVSSSGWSTWDDGTKRVVFFSGVRIKPGLFGGTAEQPESKWRGADDGFIVEDEETGPYGVEVELFGDDWSRICEDEEAKLIGNTKA